MQEQYSSAGSALIFLCIFEFSVVLLLLPELHHYYFSNVYIYQLVNEQLQTSDSLTCGICHGCLAAVEGTLSSSPCIKWFVCDFYLGL